MKLKNYQEIIGKLCKLEYNKDGVTLNFTIEKNIKIPEGKISKEKLDKGLNKKIGILRIDDEYKIIISE